MGKFKEKSNWVEWESHYENSIPNVDLAAFSSADWQHPYFKRLKIYSKEAERVLEFGSGKGHISFSLKRLRPSITTFLLDYSLTAVRFSKKVHHYFGLQANFINGSFLELPFRSNSFDIVHGNTVLEHVIDTRQALSELSRVIRPGGYLIATVPNRNRHIDGHDIYKFIHRIGYVSSSFKIQELENLYESVGLIPVDIFGQGLTYFFPSYPLRIGLIILKNWFLQGRPIRIQGIRHRKASQDEVPQELTAKQILKKLLKLPISLADHIWGSVQSKINAWANHNEILPPKIMITVGLVGQKL